MAVEACEVTDVWLAMCKYTRNRVNHQCACGGRGQSPGFKLYLVFTQLQKPGQAAGVVPRLQGR